MSHLVILMGSPRPGGNTAQLVNAFVSGLDARHTVDILPAAQMNLHPCTGCNACFHSADNACVQQDDMAACYARMAKADILVVATPLYFYSVSAQLKILIDRLHNPIRANFQVKKLVLLAVAGNAEPSVFDPLIALYHTIRTYFHLEDSGILTVPGVRRANDISDHPALEQARALGASL